MSGALGPPGYGGGGSLDILAGYLDSSLLGLHSARMKMLKSPASLLSDTDFYQVIKSSNDSLTG